MHPTKALAQDQLRSWAKLAIPGIVISTYDGDSTADSRTATRRFSDVWLTNPEMLNASILAHHQSYDSLLSRLDFIVIDEAHVYRGVFGSHVSLLIRRLARIARIYGSSPRFICTSATMSDPGATCSRLVNEQVVSIDEDFSPRAPRTIAVWKPKMLDAKIGVRASYTKAAAAISARCSDNNHRVITFVRSRRQSEVMANSIRGLDDSRVAKVLSYRGGYLAAQRRAIEQAFADGEADVLVSTSAMELGVDIGSLDVAVIAGFPGTFASFRQQSGRVGRSLKESASILVSGPDALDQWIALHPRALIDRPSERSVINPSNPYILEAHLRAACFESPLDESEVASFADLDDPSSSKVRAALAHLESKGEIGKIGSRWVTTAHSAPHRAISLRTSGPRQVLISTEDGELIGISEYDRALHSLHQGAIYLHLGKSFKVTSLDLERDMAIVERYQGDEQTRTIFDTYYENGEPEAQLDLGTIRICTGPTRITTVARGFQVLSPSGETLSQHPLELPASVLDTKGFWLEFTPESLKDIPERELPGALHAAEHAMISMMPVFAICDRSDIGGVSRLLVPDPFAKGNERTPVATITIYDGYPGGIGISDLAYSVAGGLVSHTLSMVQSCECEHGCPSCIHSPKCGNLNSPLSKAYSVILAQAVLRGFPKVS